jgi:hypothetical protein
MGTTHSSPREAHSHRSTQPIKHMARQCWVPIGVRGGRSCAFRYAVIQLPRFEVEGAGVLPTLLL